MSTSIRTRRSWRPILTVAAIAAVTPVLWLAAVTGDLPRVRADIELAIRLSLVSALFWTGVAAWLTASRRTLASALGIGALSPVLALLLAICIGLPLLPIETLVSTPTVTSWLGVYGLVFVFLRPLLFFPVGVAMGVCAWAIATPRRRPRETPLMIA